MKELQLLVVLVVVLFTLCACDSGTCNVTDCRTLTGECRVTSYACSWCSEDCLKSPRCSCFYTPGD